MSFPEEEIYSLVRRSQNPLSPCGTNRLPPWTSPAKFGLLLQGDLYELIGGFLPGMFLRCHPFQSLVSYLFLYLGPVRLAWVGFNDNPEFSASALSEPGLTPCLWPHAFRSMVGGSASSAFLFKIWSFAERTQGFYLASPLPLPGLNLWDIRVEFFS